MKPQWMCLSLADAAAQLPAAQLLTATESVLFTQRAARQQINFLAGRYTLKKLLRAHCGHDWLDWEIRPSPTGQPLTFLNQCKSPLHVSISHSKSRVACAISAQAIGIDIEDQKARTDVAALVERIATLDEQNWWRQQSDALNAFYKLWTHKEALGKLQGTGLSLAQATPANVEVCYLIDDTKSVCALARYI